ncbi:uncharacterized protein LOC144924760 [Branchiostoma floridae x Branchiostoma belcheri]
MWTLLLMLPLLCGTGVLGYDYQTDYMSGNCGSTISLSDSGFISWSYSGDYGNNEDCTVVFFTDNPNTVISLQFLQVDIESCIDHLYIYDGAYITTSFVTANEDICNNNNIPSEFISTTNYITLRLTSDGSEGGTFRLLYTKYLRKGDADRIRLVGGTGPHEGRVEVRLSGSSDWGTVCDDNFGTDDAYVACRTLGYSGAVRTTTEFGRGSGNIYMDDLRCSGTENSLFDCWYSGWGLHDCAHSEDIGVVCYTSTLPTSPCSADYFHCSNGYCISSALQCDTILNCPDGGDENCADRLRLVGGSGPNEGRLEVRLEGSYTWGTVCDDQFEISDAHVACRMLGYSEASEVHGSAHFGQGSGDIYMDDVQCSGDESSLFDCPYAGWGVHNCRHSEDVGIVCAIAAAGLSGGEIAGIVIGVLTGIVVLTLIVHNCNKSSANSSPSSRVSPNRVLTNNTVVQRPNTAPPQPTTMTQAPLPPIPTVNQPPPPPQQFPPPPAYSAALAMPAQAPGGTTPYPAPSPNQEPAYAPQPPQGAQLHPSPAVLYPPPDSSVPPPPHYLPPLANAPQLPPAY